MRNTIEICKKYTCEICKKKTLATCGKRTEITRNGNKKWQANTGIIFTFKYNKHE